MESKRILADFLAVNLALNLEVIHVAVVEALKITVNLHEVKIEVRVTALALLLSGVEITDGLLGSRGNHCLQLLLGDGHRLVTRLLPSLIIATLVVIRLVLLIPAIEELAVLSVVGEILTVLLAVVLGFVVTAFAAAVVAIVVGLLASGLLLVVVGIGVSVEFFGTLDLLKKTNKLAGSCLLYTSPSPRDLSTSRMPSSA